MSTPEEWASAFKDGLDEQIAAAEEFRRRCGPHMSAAMDGWIANLQDMRKRAAALPSSVTPQPNDLQHKENPS